MPEGMPEMESTGFLLLEHFATDSSAAFFCYYPHTAALHVGPSWGRAAESLPFHAHQLSVHFQQ